MSPKPEKTASTTMVASIEDWFERKKPPRWRYAVALATEKGWGAGKQVSEAEFSAAMDRAGKHTIRG